MTRYVAPPVVVALIAILLGCTPQPSTDEDKNPFASKQLPDDIKDNNDDSKCGMHRCGDGTE